MEGGQNMNNIYKPIDIARKLNVSTSTLRGYEERELVPPAERMEQGYRLYTNIHFAYFECIVHMSPGFGMETTSSVIKKIQRNDLDSALWIINEAQMQNYKDINLLNDVEHNVYDIFHYKTRIEKPETIHIISEKTKVSPSTIRYWDTQGYIQSHRDEQNNYRMFDSFQFLKILLMKLTQAMVYSEDVVLLKQSIKDLQAQDIERVKTILDQCRKQFNKRNERQLRALFYLQKLCDEIMINH